MGSGNTSLPEDTKVFFVVSCFFFNVSEQKFRSRFKVSGPLQYYRCAIKWWLLDTGARDVYPEGGDMRGDGRKSCSNLVSFFPLSHEIHRSHFI